MSIEIDLVDALRRLAEAGTVADATDFVVVVEAVRIRVLYIGGSSSSLTLSTSYDASAARLTAPSGAGAQYRASAFGPLRAIRPMSIVLSRETSDHVDAKASGINVEYQSGDPAFDGAVYVDSPTDDRRVLDAVLHPGTRGAVLELFALGTSSVEIDRDGRVVTTMNGFVSTESAGEKGKKLVVAFHALASGMPKVEASGGKHEALPWGGRTAVAGVLAVSGMVAAPVAFFWIASTFACTEGTDDGVSLKDGCGVAGIAGILFGIAAGCATLWLVSILATAKLRGRSSSFGRIAAIRMAAFALGAELGFVVAAAIAFGLGLAHPK